MKHSLRIPFLFAMFAAISMAVMIPTRAIAGGAECDYFDCSGEWWEVWECEWKTCPSNQTCEWLAMPRKCRHQPPWEGEPCTIFSGTIDDPLNFCSSMAWGNSGVEEFYCKGFTDFLAGTCTAYSKVGEWCDGIQTVCANVLGNTGRMCRPAILTPDSPVVDIALFESNTQCYPNYLTLELVQTGDQEAKCKDAYSESVHKKLMENYQDSNGESDLPMTMSYASGVGSTVIGGVIDEVGVVYSGDGVYACYKSACAGFGASVGANMYVSQGIYDNSYDDFKRGNFQTEFDAGAILGASYSAIGEWDGIENIDDAEKVGDMVTFWLGIDFIPVPVGASYIWCDTEVEYEFVWNPDKEILESLTPRLECRNSSECADPVSCVADVSISSNPLSEPVPVEQVPPGPYEIGSGEVTLQSQLPGEAVSCSAIAEVVDCTAPDMICPDRVVECTGPNGAFVHHDYPTILDCSEVGVEMPEDRVYPIGESDVYFIGTDADNNQAICHSTVTVMDTIAPRISLRASPDTLWPPDNKMKSVQISLEVEDACDLDPFCYIETIASNEQTGKKGFDWVINDDFSVDLRASRDGNGSGRAYTATVACEDLHGNRSTEQVNVVVPHDQGENKADKRKK